MSILSRRIGSWLRSRATRPAPVRRRVRLGIEALEERWVPSTLTVTNLNDSGSTTAGDGSLRGEVMAAQNGDTIVFQQGLTGTINLTSTLEIGKSLTITGPNSGTIALSGGGMNEVLKVDANTIVSLSDLTIENGFAASGGGIDNLGSLSLTNVSVSGNTATTFGGGIYNAGLLSITNSSLTQNSITISDGTGQVSVEGAGLYNNGQATITDSAIDDNTLQVTETGVGNNGFFTFSASTGLGAGIGNEGSLLLTGGSVSGNTLRSTITVTNAGFLNSSAEGGGLYNNNQAIIQGTTFSQNAITSSSSNAGAYGGGIYNNSYLKAMSITVSGNSADGGTGIALGGALFTDSLASLQSSTLSNNSATTTGGGQTQGGGIYNQDLLQLDEVQLTNNTATSGTRGSLGGGLFNNTIVSLTNSLVSGNLANGTGIAEGGGIYSSDQLTVTGSTIAGNSAAGASGSSSLGGGLYNSFELTLLDSTVGNNVTQAGSGGTSQGGGIYNSASSGGKNYLTLINVTVAGNQALGSVSGVGQGGGIYNAAFLSMTNTLVATNTASDTGNDLDNVAPGVVNIDHSLIGDGTGSGLTNGQNGNLVGTSTNPLNPDLGPLQNNGGLTPTFALLAGSSAINAGSNSATGFIGLTDQTGANRLAGGTIDIGSYEYQGSTSPGTPTITTLVVTSLVDSPNATAGDGSLRGELLAAQNGDTIVFEPGLTGTIFLSSTLTIGDNVTIVGPGAADLALNGGEQYQVLTIAGNTIVSISGLTIEDGRSTNNGGGITNNGSLALSHATVTHNTAIGSNAKGGGIYSNLGPLLALNDDTISSNTLVTNDSSGYDALSGGGVFNGGTALVLNTSFLDNTISITQNGSSNNFNNVFGEGAGLENAGLLLLKGGLFTGNTLSVYSTTTTTSNVNVFAFGGGLANDEIASIQGTTFSQNRINVSAVPGKNNTTIEGEGGGLFTDDLLSATDLAISNNTVNANNGLAQGGGLYNSLGATIQDSVLADNQAITSGSGTTYGGGLYTDAFLLLQNVQITGNTATGGAGGSFGAGLENDFILVMEDSTVAANTANGSGNAQGGGISNTYLLTLYASTIDGNTAAGAAGSRSLGGGIYNGDMLYAINSTVGNNITEAGSGGASQGGGIYNSGINGATATLALINTTVAGNQALGSVSGVGQGGGIYNTQQLSLANTLVAGNTASDTDNDLDNTNTGLLDVEFSLIGDGTGSGLSNGQNGNLVGTSTHPLNPLLGPLQLNGGPTPTFALLADSPALGTGTTSVLGFTGPEDQRGTGFARVVNGLIDIGSYQTQPAPTTPTTPITPPTTTTTTTTTNTTTPTSTQLMEVLLDAYFVIVGLETNNTLLIFLGLADLNNLLASVPAPVAQQLDSAFANDAYFILLSQQQMV